MARDVANQVFVYQPGEGLADRGLADAGGRHQLGFGDASPRLQLTTDDP
jgi:hypothetical protein